MNSIKQKRLEKQKRRCPPSFTRSVRAAATAPRSSMQFSPEKFENAPSNIDSGFSSLIRSVGKWQKTTGNDDDWLQRRCSAIAIICCEASHANREIPLLPRKIASSPVPQLSSRILSLGLNVLVRTFHTASR